MSTDSNPWIAGPVPGRELDEPMAVDASGRSRRGPSVARRRRAQPGGRVRALTVKLTEDERARLGALAAEQGSSIGRLLVESALTGRSTPAANTAALSELNEARRLAATVANNVNQLARIANRDRETPAGAELVALREQVLAATARLQQAADGIRRR